MKILSVVFLLGVILLCGPAQSAAISDSSPQERVLGNEDKDYKPLPLRPRDVIPPSTYSAKPPIRDMAIAFGVVFSFGFLLFSPLSGYLSDRFSRAKDSGDWKKAYRLSYLRLSFFLRSPDILFDFAVSALAFAPTVADPEKRRVIFLEVESTLDVLCRKKPVLEAQKEFVEILARVSSDMSVPDRRRLWDKVEEMNQRWSEGSANSSYFLKEWIWVLSLRAESEPDAIEVRRIWERATTKIKDVLRHNPGDAWGWRSLGGVELMYAYEESDCICDAVWDQVEEKYRKAVALAPGDSSFWHDWGQILAQRAESESSPTVRNRLWEAADFRHQEILALAPDNAVGQSSWGWVLSQRAKGDLDVAERLHLLKQAAEKYERATQLDSSYAWGWHGWGFVLEQCIKNESDNAAHRRLWEQVEEKYARAVALAPDDEAFSQAWRHALDKSSENEVESAKRTQ